MSWNFHVCDIGARVRVRARDLAAGGGELFKELETGSPGRITRKRTRDRNADASSQPQPEPNFEKIRTVASLAGSVLCACSWNAMQYSLLDFAKFPILTLLFFCFMLPRHHLRKFITAHDDLRIAVYSASSSIFKGIGCQ